jgi:hypothetical protein
MLLEERAALHRELACSERFGNQQDINTSSSGSRDRAAQSW